ncbi:GNAT family N-acetyltransferase [Kitasatospora cinereorecta]|uniref:GNAT family N-acetyltransferase n=1 Tax=Kitasatospora cinereorecta TaxID=285560 RepID=A0ABW0VD77_9ACTN
MPTRPFPTVAAEHAALPRTRSQELAGRRHPVLDSWFLPETPGPDTLAAHVLQTGNGGIWTDRAESPRVALLHCGPQRVLRGDPRYVAPDRLALLGRGQFSAPDCFLPLLGRTFVHVFPWVRVICTQQRRPATHRDLPADVRLRQLGPADAVHLDALAPGLRWITETWGSGRALAFAGTAWGAFADDRLVSLAVGHLRGLAHEDVAVATVPEYRRRGLALACVRATTAAIRRRGRMPSWTVPRSNDPSRALAAAAGFVPVRAEVAYWVGPAA